MFNYILNFLQNFPQFHNFKLHSHFRGHSEATNFFCLIFSIPPIPFANFHSQYCWMQRKSSVGMPFSKISSISPPCLSFIFLLICSLIPIGCLAQQSDRIRQKCLSVEASKNCGACISTSPECAWCADTVWIGFYGIYG